MHLHRNLVIRPGSFDFAQDDPGGSRGLLQSRRAEEARLVLVRRREVECHRRREDFRLRRKVAPAAVLYG